MKLQGLGVIAILCLAPACDDGDDDGNTPTVPPRCGDGVANSGESSDNCCVDVGCPRGVCDTTAMTCVHPWMFTCPADTGACADELPYVCNASPPSYDCTSCGCPDGHSCFEDYCFADDMPAMEHGYDPADDLPLDDYFPMINWAGSAAAISFNELADELDTALREDGRRAALLLGESHSSQDEQAVGVQIMREMSARGWVIPTVGIEGTSMAPILDPELFADLGLTADFINGDLTNVAYCGAALGHVGDTINTQGLYVQYTGSGHTSQEICHHPYHWSICDLPHTAECLASAGRKSITVILFDPEVWLTSTDRILLWRLGDYYPVAADVTTNLEAFLAGWDGHMSAQQTEPRFDATVNGRDVNVRVLHALHADDVYFAYFPRPNRPARLMRAFGAVWNDLTLQAFLLAHDIQPGNCSISWDLTPGAETMWLYCGNDGYEVEAQVDASTWVLESSSTITP